MIIYVYHIFFVPDGIAPRTAGKREFRAGKEQTSCRH